MPDQVGQFEPRETTRPPHARSARLDASAVAGFSIACVAAAVQYVVGILLCGLVAGHVGGFVLAILTGFGADSIVRGRQWGWIAGAVVAAVGLPLGWIRPDNKRFSFPSPRTFAGKARKKFRSRAARQNRFRSVKDVLKCGGGLGLIGLLLGVLLTGVLVMCWFSLAISPLPLDEWAASIELQRDSVIDDHWTRPRGGRTGTSMTSSHPVLQYLIVVPPLALGALGAAGGTLLGAVQYVRFRAG